MQSHIWLRLPRCLLGRDIFWQVARASDGGHWFYPPKESGPSFLLSTMMGMAFRMCPPRFSLNVRALLSTLLPFPNTQSTRLFSILVRAEYRPRTRSCPSLPCPTFPCSGRGRAHFESCTRLNVEFKRGEIIEWKILRNFEHLTIFPISCGRGKILKFLPIEQDFARSKLLRVGIPILNCSVFDFRISKFGG